MLFSLCITFPGIKNICFDTKIKFLCNLEAEIWTFKNSLVTDGGHFEYCSIKKNAQHAQGGIKLIFH